MIVPNSTPVPNYFLDTLMPRLSGAAFKCLIAITRKTLGWEADPITKRRKEKDWIAYSQLTKLTGLQKQAVTSGIRELETLNIIEVLDENGNKFENFETRRGKRLTYRINTEYQNMDENHPPMGENQSLKITHTKETNTKTILRIGKKPSCPLLNGSPLRAKYPNGHTECSEYLLSLEEPRSFKFSNKAKQFLFLHKLIGAGYDFGDIDRLIAAVEKKYGNNQWDFSTLANWADKGA